MEAKEKETITIAFMRVNRIFTLSQVWKMKLITKAEQISGWVLMQ